MTIDQIIENEQAIKAATDKLRHAEHKETEARLLVAEYEDRLAICDPLDREQIALQLTKAMTTLQQANETCIECATAIVDILNNEAC
jgi:hypothetical protein